MTVQTTQKEQANAFKTQPKAAYLTKSSDTPSNSVASAAAPSLTQQRSASPPIPAGKASTTTPEKASPSKTTITDIFFKTLVSMVQLDPKSIEYLQTCSEEQVKDWLREQTKISEDIQGRGENSSEMQDLQKNNENLSAKLEELVQIKTAVLTHAAELEKLIPKEGSPVGQITPKYIETTLRNCIEQVTSLKNLLGIETEQITVAATSQTIESDETKILKILETLQNETQNLQGAAETKFKSISITTTSTIETIEALTKFLEPLLEETEKASTLKPQIIKIIQKLQNDIETGRTPEFTPDFLSGIETVTGWYTREQQEKDIAQHRKYQQSKINDLSEILTRWTTIERVLDRLLFKIEIELLNNGNEETKKRLIEIKSKISNLAIDQTIITEPSVKDKIVLSQFNDFETEIKAFPILLRSTRKIISDMGVPADEQLKTFHQERLKARFEIQKAKLLDFNYRNSLITPYIDKVIEMLQQKVDLGECEEKVPTTSLNRLGICMGIKAADIIEKHIKPFEQAHQERKTLLVELKKGREAIVESTNLAKKEVNRTFDAIKNNGVYCYETTYNIRGHTDPDVDATFGGKDSNILTCTSPQVPDASLTASSSGNARIFM